VLKFADPKVEFVFERIQGISNAGMALRVTLSFLPLLFVG